jgi:DNA-binding transcriptional ArsR family regulator
MTATALAQALDVSATQLANHLRRLRDAELISVEHHGRLAVYQLYEAGLREIFSMLNGLRGTPSTPPSTTPDAVACYDHIAGRVGVALLDHLIAHGALLERTSEGQLTLGPHTSKVLRNLGIDHAPRASRRMPAYACMDSTLRRPHLGGYLGAEIAHHFKAEGWIHTNDTQRDLTLTPEGRHALKRLGVPI